MSLPLGMSSQRSFVFLAASLVFALLGGVVAIAAADGQQRDTGCWEEYGRAGFRGLRGPLQVVTPDGVDVDECTAAPSCFFGYQLGRSAPNRVFIPFGDDPNVACGAGENGPLLPAQFDRRTPRSVVSPQSTSTSTSTSTTTSTSTAAPTPISVAPKEPETTTSTSTTSTTTTQAPDTSQSTDPNTGSSTSTAAPTTTTTSTTTTSTTTTTQPASVGVGFVETFDNNTGLNRFHTGVYHRDEFLVSSVTWQGDHDADCGPPGTSRTIHRDNPNDIFYTCRDHLMTAVGDTAGYSTAFFTPKTTFINERSVSWDVNITDLGARQWWEVAILPLSSDDLVAARWLSPDPTGLDPYPNNSIVVGNGPFGRDFQVFADGSQSQPLSAPMCATDPEACGSKAIRRTFTVTDNGNGTVTVEAFGQKFLRNGSFPSGGFKVVFKDHNYTPDKDGVPVGYTWHWDNIIIK